MRFNTYLSFSVTCFVTFQESQVDALSVEMLDSLGDCVDPQIFIFSEDHMNLAQTARSHDSEDIKAKQLAAAKATLKAAKEARAKMDPLAKARMTYEQRVLSYIEEQEATAIQDEIEGKQWQHPDWAGFVLTIVAGFMDGIGLADAFGAGRDQIQETKDMAAETLNNQHTKDIMTAVASSNTQPATTITTDTSGPFSHENMARIVNDVNLAQTVSTAELGADASHNMWSFPVASLTAHLVCMFAGWNYGNWYINLLAKQSGKGVKEGLMSHLFSTGRNKIFGGPKIQAPLKMDTVAATPMAIMTDVHQPHVDVHQPLVDVHQQHFDGHQTFAQQFSSAQFDDTCYSSVAF